jgi:hypothetical protein
MPSLSKQFSYIEAGARRGRNAKQSKKDFEDDIEKRRKHQQHLNQLNQAHIDKHGISVQKQSVNTDSLPKRQMARSKHPRFGVVEDAQDMSQRIVRKEKHMKEACELNPDKSHIPLTSTKHGKVKGGTCVDYTLPTKVEKRKPKVPYVNRRGKLRKATSKQIKYWSSLIDNFDKKVMPMTEWNGIVKKFKTQLDAKQEHRG